MSAAHLLYSACAGATADGAGELAIRAGDGMAGADGALGSRLLLVYDRASVLARVAHHESGGGGSHWVSGAGSRADIRSELSAFIPGVGFTAAFAAPLVERTSGPLVKGLAGLGDGNQRPFPRAARGAVSRRDAAARRDFATRDARARDALPGGRGGWRAGHFLFLRANAYLGHDSSRTGAADGCLPSPCLILRLN